jgi:hypothetical protein
MDYWSAMPIIQVAPKSSTASTHLHRSDKMTGGIRHASRDDPLELHQRPESSRSEHCRIVCRYDYLPRKNIAN